MAIEAEPSSCGWFRGWSLNHVCAIGRVVPVSPWLFGSVGFRFVEANYLNFLRRDISLLNLSSIIWNFGQHEWMHHRLSMPGRTSLAKSTTDCCPTSFGRLDSGRNDNAKMLSSLCSLMADGSSRHQAHRPCFSAWSPLQAHPARQPPSTEKSSYGTSGCATGRCGANLCGLLVRCLPIFRHRQTQQ